MAADQTEPAPGDYVTCPQCGVNLEVFQTALRHAKTESEAWYAAFLNLRKMCVDLRVELALARDNVADFTKDISEQNKTIKILSEQGEVIPMRRPIGTAPENKILLFFPADVHTSCSIYPFCTGVVQRKGPLPVVNLTDGKTWPLKTFSHWFDPELLPCR